MFDGRVLCLSLMSQSLRSDPSVRASPVSVATIDGECRPCATVTDRPFWDHPPVRRNWARQKLDIYGYVPPYRPLLVSWLTHVLLLPRSRLHLAPCLSPPEAHPRHTALTARPCAAVLLIHACCPLVDAPYCSSAYIVRTPRPPSTLRPCPR